MSTNNTLWLAGLQLGPWQECGDHLQCSKLLLPLWKPGCHHGTGRHPEILLVSENWCHPSQLCMLLTDAVRQSVSQWVSESIPGDVWLGFSLWLPPDWLLSVWVFCPMTPGLISTLAVGLQKVVFAFRTMDRGAVKHPAVPSSYHLVVFALPSSGLLLLGYMNTLHINWTHDRDDAAVLFQFSCVALWNFTTPLLLHWQLYSGPRPNTGIIQLTGLIVCSDKGSLWFQ